MKRNYSSVKSDTITIKVCGYEMKVGLDYFPAYQGRRENGLQLEPDEDAGFDVTSVALVDPADMFEIITEEVSITLADVEAAVSAYDPE